MDEQMSKGTAIFVGRGGSDLVTFVCLADGRYGMFRGGRTEAVWGERDLVYGLGVYMRMIARTSRTHIPTVDRPDTFQRPIVLVNESRRDFSQSVA